MSTRNISLTDHFDRFVDQQISVGRFQDDSEVMRAGLRLLEEQTQRENRHLEVLKALVDEGFRQIDQGQGIEIHGDAQLEQLMDDIERRAVDAVHRRQAGNL